MVELIANIFADGPQFDPYNPDKQKVRDWGTWVEGNIAAFVNTGGRIFVLKSTMDGIISPDKDSMAWVLGDPVVENNGIYKKIGVSGTGSWQRMGDLPYSFIIANDAGAGAANAIQATSSIPVSASALVWLEVATTNTSAPVTVQFNGGPVLIVKTNAGNDVAPGGLRAGTIVLGIRRGATFRLVSDQASTAIVAAAEAAKAAAEAAAASASIRNVTSRAAIKALVVATSTLAFLNTNLDSGMFKWQTGDFAARVAADPLEAVYIKSNAVPATSGAWVRQHEGLINLRWFGAVGDYTTDDTAAIQAWLNFFGSAAKFPLYLPQGNFRSQNNLVWPKGLIMRGAGSAKLGTFPQYDLYNKDNLRPGYKHLIGGSNLIFSGTPTNTVSGGRADTVNIRPLGIYNHYAPCDIEGVSFIQDMDVRNAAGALTTKATDNRATGYTHGIFHRGTLSRFEDVTVFGYFFGGRGFIHDNVPGDDGGIGNDPDYPKFISCYISFGVAILGNETPVAEGNTGSEWLGCSLFGGDHHTRADSDPLIPCLEIDIPLTSVQQGRGHSFSSCAFRTCVNDAIKLNRCSDILFANMATEFSEVAGVPGLDLRGTIVGTANTGNVTISGVAASGDLGLPLLRKTVTGRLTVSGVTNGLGGGMVVAQNMNWMRGVTLAVASGVVSPTGNYHLIDSTGSPTITSIATADMKTGDWVMFRRSGAGTITFNTTGNISLGGAATMVLNSAADIAIFLIDGSNAWLITFSNNA